MPICSFLPGFVEAQSDIQVSPTRRCWHQGSGHEWIRPCDPQSKPELGKAEKEFPVDKWELVSDQEFRLRTQEQRNDVSVLAMDLIYHVSSTLKVSFMGGCCPINNKTLQPIRCILIWGFQILKKVRWELMKYHQFSHSFVQNTKQSKVPFKECQALFINISL